MYWFSRDSFRDFAVAANDGIIGAAGVLQGFAGAGATSRTLLVASISAMVAASVAGFGAKYAELAAARDAERALIVDARKDLAEGPEDDLVDLAGHFEELGAPEPLALEVAERMIEHDGLAATLKTAHGIDEPTPGWFPLAGALWNAFSVAVGSALPLAVLLLYPRAIESWAVVVAVILSLIVTSFIIAAAARASIWRALRRTLLIGIATMTLSYLAGVLIF
ncbi:hypothetical protein ET445_05305 [Agromyces protaetiae]|uniref:VIT family protein n=1 Tax=Agromyces protaetiae TaxID=2509455 RepID=A0A4P6FEQ8_9MICO|nr:VIT1/CCC1 transporter family protein [Agromyces protaetiae]QAY72849.1 hypothetical protein ET445_05305 [Agromyces protaetiae]